MEYVIGIDGGGTKTLLKIADLKGHLLSECEGGPSNINSAGSQCVAGILKELISKGLSDLNENLDNCKVLCIGAAGVDRPDDKKIMEDIIKSTGYQGRMIITNDAVTALYGGTGSGEGIIMISGTGSICYGRNSSGMVCRAGGWGHIIGDEGSGYDIGVKALSAVMKSFDGRIGSTSLTGMILKYLNLKGPESLIEYVYRSGAGKKEIAGLARVVDQAYQAGDNTAKEILGNAAHDLYLCCSTVMEKLGLGCKHAVVAISGSVITKNKYILTEFVRLVKKNYPESEIINVKNDAAWGAVLIALDKI